MENRKIGDISILNIVFIASVLMILVAGCSAKASVQKSDEALENSSMTCPQGMNDSPSPGTCWAFADKNKDGLCDSS